MVLGIPSISEALNFDTIRENTFGPRPPYGVVERLTELSDYGVRSATCLSAFGNSYIDFGWWSVIPFMVAGVIAGYLSGRVRAWHA